MTRPTNNNRHQTFVAGRCPYLDRIERNRPSSQIPPDVEIPGPGEEVAWSGHLRADLPEYVLDQLRDVAHRQRCTLVSLLLKMMASHRDAGGRNLFRIRPEDLVADRRKVTRARG
jgi:hypothetical protein